jgi:hypothetical protein
MKLTKTKLKQIIREELKKEGFFGDMASKAKEKFDKFTLQQGEYARQGAEKMAQYEKEKEERRKKRKPRPGEPGGKKFPGSGFGIDITDKLREEEDYRDAADDSMADTVPHS